MSTKELELYDLLKAKLGENVSKAFFTVMEQKVENNIEKKEGVLASKEDIHELDLKIERTKSDLIKWMFIFWIGQLAAIFTMIKVFFS